MQGNAFDIKKCVKLLYLIAITRNRRMSHINTTRGTYIHIKSLRHFVLSASSRALGARVDETSLSISRMR